MNNTERVSQVLSIINGENITIVPIDKISEWVSILSDSEQNELLLRVDIQNYYRIKCAIEMARIKNVKRNQLLKESDLFKDFLILLNNIEEDYIEYLNNLNIDELSKLKKYIKNVSEHEENDYYERLLKSIKDIIKEKQNKLLPKINN